MKNNDIPNLYATWSTGKNYFTNIEVKSVSTELDFKMLFGLYSKKNPPIIRLQTVKYVNGNITLTVCSELFN